MVRIQPRQPILRGIMYYHKRKLKDTYDVFTKTEAKCAMCFVIVRCPACGNILGWQERPEPGLPLPQQTYVRVFCNEECIEAVPCSYESLRQLSQREVDG